jgi:Na+/H+ antiporter NhaD/arsenite permease-like protein
MLTQSPPLAKHPLLIFYPQSFLLGKVSSHWANRMTEAFSSTDVDRRLLLAIGLVLVAYGVTAAFHLPQRATERIVAVSGPGLVEESPAAPSTSHVAQHPPYWMLGPFALLLGAIAVLPLVPATSHWWHSNLHRFYVAGGLAAITLAYYLLLHASVIEAHWPAPHAAPPATHGLNFVQTGEVLANAILGEYIPFIVLLWSLYTISGGIRIEGDLPAHPLTNAAFLAAGAVLASFIGTTGAAMLLIRPLLETNRERKHVQHTVVFFIFIVCNCGGLLLPLGDPPLFLGYLMGVPFLWTKVLWKEWLLVNVALLAIYYVWDRFWRYPQERPADLTRDAARVHRLRCGGLWPNAFLLLGLVLAVACLDPGKAVPGTGWHPWLYLREMVQLGLVGLSLALGSSHLRRQNRFNYTAILEVAALFFGIFICMQPPLQILAVEGPKLGLTEPWQYFWASGSLSSVLDNAPTYVVFFQTAASLTGTAGLGPAVAGVAERLLVAISLGSVFMGANTYIGNGPNFMVRAIAEESGVAMPSFFGYLAYSGAVLIPLFVLVTFLFL